MTAMLGIICVDCFVVLFLFYCISPKVQSDEKLEHTAFLTFLAESEVPFAAECSQHVFLNYC